MAFSDLLCHMARSPALAVTVLLTLAVLVVNGWTDAPNAIAGVVVSGALPFPAAAALAALCNCAGVLSVTAAAPVARTIYSMARFGGTPRQALCALCAAMTAIVLWAVAAWWLGIPTSESHALAAGLTGAAVAQAGDLSCIRWWAWGRVLGGLILSVLLAFWAGRAVQRRLARLRPPCSPAGPAPRGGGCRLSPRGPGRAEAAGCLPPGAGPGTGPGGRTAGTGPPVAVSPVRRRHVRGHGPGRAADH